MPWYRITLVQTLLSILELHIRQNHMANKIVEDSDSLRPCESDLAFAWRSSVSLLVSNRRHVSIRESFTHNGYISVSLPFTRYAGNFATAIGSTCVLLQLSIIKSNHIY